MAQKGKVFKQGVNSSGGFGLSARSLCAIPHIESAYGKISSFI
jgi:hypothetical protein